ncbi:8-oxo-dGTP pyrophosphatase MutT (NUDIX family) [Deinococcus soli (ex Cha et al. 2016)]|uniref:8-oxo-dGTP pyrophosphatase MutT (NUDIX family) n=2 Tax=Deinococcus soli (ex Cha et al. 2016) TaxID=1309411 RepID=A0ACC6KLD2_9DEIO|nr:8-oxo-dGTP pyrophosphatase MutT (NUDIX family) [Deinococcus soli (ex Cha et al. 2016)]MDR6753315.1 8-oxo-dGTP pyrophosphatase MutT (NUDIX family) [Deinococcus soli (ex Cha et al. 2016)]
MDRVTYIRDLRGEEVLLQRRSDTGGWGTPGGLRRTPHK